MSITLGDCEVWIVPRNLFMNISSDGESMPSEDTKKTMVPARFEATYNEGISHHDMFETWPLDWGEIIPKKLW